SVFRRTVPGGRASLMQTILVACRHVSARTVQKAARLVVGLEKGLHSLPQLRFRAALLLEDEGTASRIHNFDGLEEHTLNALRVDRHDLAPHKLDLPPLFHASSVSPAVEKKQKAETLDFEGVTKPGPGIGPLLSRLIDGDLESGGDPFVTKPR